MSVDKPKRHCVVHGPQNFKKDKNGKDIYIGPDLRPAYLFADEVFECEICVREKF